MKRRIIKLLRGHNLRDDGKSFIPEDGEICWGVDTNELFVGDGKKSIAELKGIGNICKAPNGRLYSVDADNFGNATIKPLSMYIRNGFFKGKYELYGGD